MDDSFGAAMAGLVIEDASRMSGARFADARGAGVARRVRTRRRVRAAGMGGASAVAVGAIALGATHWPGTSAGPAVGIGDCATPWPEPYPYDVQKRYADYLPETWIITHPASEEIVFTITPEDVGQTWLVTYPSGATEAVPYSGASEVRVDVPDGPSILLSVWMIDGGTEMAVTAYSVTSGGPMVAPSDGCSGQGSNAAALTPFECGYVFEAEAHDSPHLAVVATEWITPATSSAWGDNSSDSAWVDGTVDKSGNAAHGVVQESLGDDASPGEVVGRSDPGDVEVRDAQRLRDGTFTGEAFVSVRDGVVVGTLRDDFTTGDAMLAVTGMGDHQRALSLAHPENAFVACPGEEPSDVSLDVYYVASVVTMKRGDPNPVAGPEYAYSHIGRFRGDVPSDYYPSN